MATEFRDKKPIHKRTFGERIKDLFRQRIVSPVPGSEAEERTFGERVKHLFLPPIPSDSKIKVIGEPVINFKKLFKSKEKEEKKEKPTPSPAKKEVKTPTSILTPTPTPTPPVLARNPSIDKYRVTDKVKNSINEAASKFNVPSQLLFDITLQESSFDPSLVNVTPEGKAAGNPTGLFQFTDNTWEQVKRYNRDSNSSLYKVLPNTNRKDPKTNALAAAYLIKFGQLGKWDASEDVWGEYWTPEELEEQGFYSQTMKHIPGIRASRRLSGRI